MLILTRKLQEKIVIGNDLVIQVLGIKGSQVRLGITAPKEVPILREEIAMRFAAKNTLCFPVEVSVPKEVYLNFK